MQGLAIDIGIGDEGSIWIINPYGNVVQMEKIVQEIYLDNA